MRKSLWAGQFVVATLPLLFGAAAFASVDVQTFTPAAGTSYVFTEDALMQVAPGDNKWTGERLYFHLLYNYVDDPLVEFNDTHTSRTATLVNSFNTLDLGVGILPLKNLMFSANVPMNLASIPGSSEQFGMGDSLLQAKWRFTDDDAPVAVAVIPQLLLPSGNQNLFLSNGGVGEGVMLAVERDFGPFRASGNIGYRHNSQGQYLDIDYRNQLPMSLGVYIPIGDQWGVNLEADGALSLPVNQYNNPGEFYGGGRYQISEDAVALLGASTGSIGGGGSGDFRVIAGIKFSPMDVFAPKPAPVVYRPEPRPVVRAQPIPAPKLRRAVRKVKPKAKPKHKAKARHKPAKKKHHHVKKPHPAGTPQAGGNGVEITTTTTTTTKTEVEPRHRVPAPPHQMLTPPSAPQP